MTRPKNISTTEKKSRSSACHFTPRLHRLFRASSSGYKCEKRLRFVLAAYCEALIGEIAATAFEQGAMDPIITPEMIVKAIHHNEDLKKMYEHYDLLLI